MRSSSSAHERLRRPTIAVASLSPLRRDARVLRQLHFLGERYALHVVAYGQPPPGLPGVVRVTDLGHHPLPPLSPADARLPRVLQRARTAAIRARQGRLTDIVVGGLRDRLLLDPRVGERWPEIYRRWYWSQPVHRDLFNALVSRPVDAIHANDWNTLPAAVPAAEHLQAKVVFDAHEYGPLELADDVRWLRTRGAASRWVLSTYGRRVDGCVTVAPEIAERLEEDLGVEVLLVRNVASRPSAITRRAGDGKLRLVHHGVALDHRGLEVTIDAVGACGPDVELDLVLVGDEGRIAALQRRAASRGGGRVRVLPPVAPTEIVGMLQRYDAGIFCLEPFSFNAAASLPNKLFDFLLAGLPVIVGSAPGMRRFVEEHGVGLITDEGRLDAVVQTILEMKNRSPERWWPAVDRTRATLDAALEHRPLIGLYETLLG